MRTLLIAVVVVAILSAGSYWLFVNRLDSEPAASDRCELCARAIHEPTAFVVTIADQTLRCCCPRCGLAAIKQQAAVVWSAVATDFESGTPVPADQCLFVEGADLMPCCAPSVIIDDAKVHMEKCFDRCSPSVVAFLKPEQALAFVQKHGGKMVRLATLLNEGGS